MDSSISLIVPFMGTLAQEIGAQDHVDCARGRRNALAQRVTYLLD